MMAQFERVCQILHVDETGVWGSEVVQPARKVYPDSPSADAESCKRAQIAAVAGRARSRCRCVLPRILLCRIR
jgi:hypothetical protein